MKKYRFFIVFVLAVFCLLALTSCRCEPSTEDWYLCQVTEKLTFANGAEAKLTFNGYCGLTSPFGEYASAERCQIEFSEDGGFKMSLDGEELTGTYTYRHNGYRDTSFTVTLDTGESFFGISESFYGGSRLAFEFRGVKYEFSPRSDDSYTKEEQKNDKEWLIRQLREHVEMSDGPDYYSFDPAEITISGDDYILACDGREYNLSAENTLVWCAGLDNDNVLTSPAELTSGDCYFHLTENTYIRGEDGEYYSPKLFVIYYIEPIPEEPGEPEPRTATLAELYPWLLYDGIDSIKLTLHTQNLPAGYTKHHAYLDGDELAAYLDALRKVSLREIMSEYELYEYHLVNGDTETYTTVTAFADEREYTLEFIAEVVLGEVWWSADGVPDFPYDTATQSFICYTDEIKAFDKQGNAVGVYSEKLADIEFVVCDEDHSYTTLTPWMTVETEFGEIRVYDAHHFWYKGQSYVCIGEKSFDFLFE